jgi:hypothetical protein
MPKNVVPLSRPRPLWHSTAFSPVASMLAHMLYGNHIDKVAVIVVKLFNQTQ